MRDEILEEQDTDSTFEMRKQNTEVSTRKQNKQAIKATGANSNQNSNTIKQRENNKRKFEASRATAAEGPDGESPTIQNKSLIIGDVETSKLVTN
jgi:hypothetical protein